ncbi:MAG: hypothetical protein RLY21_2148 [Planctomycetota bacterium]|jgi:hypothetical protein
MSRRQFHLLPTATVTRVRANRATRGIVFSSGCIAAVAVVVLGLSTWLDAFSRAKLAAAQKEGAPVLQIEQEVGALRSVERQLVRSLALQRTLGNTIPANGVIRAVSDTLPEGALIKSITLEYQNVQGTNRKQRKGTKEVENANPRSLVCVIEGIALDDRDVGAIVDGLSKLPSLSKVSLESSRSYEFRGKNAREYKVSFIADLEKRWRLPEIATVTESGESKP